MKKFRFIDLFSGIGGFHIAMKNIGGECVFACEIDQNARKTYIENFQKTSPELIRNNFHTDIKNINENTIPDFDILCAGFPCQPFSQSGFKRGFLDTRGTFFFDIVNILKAKKPKAIFLENVRYLLNHDSGNTFNVIKHTIEKELGYNFYYKIVKASDHGLPQHRPRLFMVGIKESNNFKFPDPIELKWTMSDILKGNCDKKIGYTLRVGGKGSSIDDRRNWDGYVVDGMERRINSREGLEMQGFPSSFKFPVSESQAMKQLGNSVAVPAVQATASNIIKEILL